MANSRYGALLAASNRVRRRQSTQSPYGDNYGTPSKKNVRPNNRRSVIDYVIPSPSRSVQNALRERLIADSSGRKTRKR